MSIQFVPQYGLPILLDTAPRQSRPSGWWMLPAMIVGFVECVAIVGWIVA